MHDLTDRLVDTVQQAVSANEPLCIQGGGSKKQLGRTPTGTVVSLADHHGVIDYSPTELVLRVRSGTRISDINQLLTQNHQRLPFEPPAYEGEATIGGTLAANQSGPATPWYGSVRDSVLGLGLINGQGQLLALGGQVMKNVAGFDLSRMQVGAMGTLGVITDVSIKVLPKFETDMTLMSAMTVSDALRQMLRFLRESLPVTGVCYWQGQLHVRLQGSVGVLRKVSHMLEGDLMPAEQADDFWRRVREQQLLKPTANQALWRANMAASETALLADYCDVFINWAGAQRWVCADDDQVAHVFSHAPLGQHYVNAGIRVTQYLGGDRSREVNGWVAAPMQRIQQRIKHACDPYGILNPKRLYSWL